MSVSSTQQPATPARSYDDLIENRYFNANRAFVAVLQGFYMDRPPGRWRWTRDPEASEILITGEHPETMRNPNPRPAISVYRASAVWDSISMSGIGSQNMFNMDRSFVDMSSASSVLTCFAKLSEEVERLAYISSIAVLQFRDVIVQYGKLHAIKGNLSISGVMPAEQVNTSFSGLKMIQIVVPWAIREAVEASVTDTSFQVRCKSVTSYVRDVIRE